ncbi:Uncharacterized protein TCAP_02214 [Tolypocladium capitatum]|uniref:NDT80 domain-containing protein n=1 Tax=Tolypocladium capitatum TaxID=45235 RepID=A0A2K3QK14_9HYPO|nr:Uncharacterized protein TCAP_02214 [Tolypocladium capitatum]
MAHAPTHAHRTGALPHLGQQLGAREQYSTTTPSFRRASEHLSRSPSFPGAAQRRHQLTASQGSLAGFAPPTARMDSGQYASRSSQTPVPPLQPVQTLGTLQYQNEAAMNPTPITVEIHGTVDKGPFLSCDQEWTCYRRNYLACVCSYTLSPYYPNIPIQFTPASASTPNSGQTFQVFGFAMCISAVVAENDQQSIELVQHTPKRDKGPINKPSKVALAPKTASSTHHSMMPYGDGSTVPGTRGLYGDGFGTPHAGGQQLPAEHTFERIQFKQATQNNGKRRAAQQYYQLIVELWADVGGPEHYVKVAYRKSAKMIVRGRSPGHYQNERRGSQGNGPGGSAGGLGGYAGMGPMGDFNSNAMLGGAGTGGYATTYDNRGNVYGSARAHEMPDEALISPDDGKALDGSKAYQYYPGAMYDGHHERVDMFNHRSGPETVVIPSMAPDSKVKNEYELGLLPRPYNSTPRAADQRQHDHFSDGKATSGGYYPSIVSPTGMNMTMT